MAEHPLPHRPLVVIVGPTAVGKSEVALALAERFNGEIISADSRQIYRGMDIGTAKPTPEERARVPHHLIDVTDPDRPLTLAEYQRMAYAAIDAVHRRGRLPFLVGGTGLYVWAVVEGWQIPPAPPDPELRRRLEERARTEGAQALYEELRQLDPEAASFIDPRNVRRVIRALEVCYQTGKPFSAQRRKNPPPYHIILIGLTRPREELYRRIDERVDRMIEQGLVEEVRRLAARYPWDLPAMTGLGYRQIGAYLRGEIPLEEAIRRIKSATRDFVHHQYNWFRLNDPRIRWFDLSQTDILTIAEWLQAQLGRMEDETASSQRSPSPDPSSGLHPHDL